MTVVALAAAFTIGMVYVVYRSLQGEEIKVPEIVGKNFVEIERELEALGLRVKKRADRYSEEAPDTILEQLPRPGETVKTGQLILVVTAKRNPDGEEKPATLQKGNQAIEDDSEKIEELISDKPKKKQSNANTSKKKSSTTRDVLSNNSNANSDDSPADSKDDKKPTESNKEGTREKKPDGAAPKTAPANTAKPPASTKTPADGDTRSRRVP